jgi:hypothetical protein
MAPTIPHGARIKIQPLDADEYREGQVVACATGGAMFAHRIVYAGRGRVASGFVVTKGDGWVLCDSPTRRWAIMGQVTAYALNGVWQAPLGPSAHERWKQFVSRANLNLIRLSLGVHNEFARRVAGIFLVVGGLCKGLAAMRPRAKRRT